jgi:hypothetical protein
MGINDYFGCGKALKRNRSVQWWQGAALRHGLFLKEIQSMR